MARGEAEALVEAVRIETRIVAGQFDKTAAGGAGGFDRVPHQLLADPAAAAGGGDTHPFDQAAHHAAAREAGDNSQLQAADDPAVKLGDVEAVAALCRNRVEGAEIVFRQRVGVLLARPAERIVGEKRDDGGDVGAAGWADPRIHRGALGNATLTRPSGTLSHNVGEGSSGPKANPGPQSPERGTRRPAAGG